MHTAVVSLCCYILTGRTSDDFDNSGTLNSEEEITQITLNVFMKLVDVVWLDKECVDEAVACIQSTYQRGEEFIFTQEQYVLWFLPFLAKSSDESEASPVTRRKKKGGRKKKK